MNCVGGSGEESGLLEEGGQTKLYVICAIECAQVDDKL